MKIFIQIITLISELLEGIVGFIFEALEFIFEISKKKKEYNSTFAPPGILLSSYNYGFCLTGKRKLTKKDCYQNALIVGGTGTGKTSVVLIPSLFTMRDSLVIHDPSGELFIKSAGYLKQKGFKIKVLNFANPQNSSGYNPLIRAQNSSDIHKVASLLVENGLGGKTKDPFWNTQAAALLAMLITIIKKQAVEFQNLYNVRQLLNSLGGNPESIDALFSEYADDVLFTEYKSFIAYDDKVVSGVIATCKAALQIFSDDYVAKVTSKDNLDFLEFRKKPTALYIQNSVADQKYYSVLTSLFFEQFFAFLLGRFPEKQEKDIFLLIDEASSLNLPTLPLAVANVRKHRSGIMLLVQDFNQLIHHYGKYDADGIRSNCFAKMYFTGASLETTKELEQTLGRYQYEDDKKRTVIRPLMTNDEIRTMNVKRALLVCGHHPPILARLKPYYKNGKYLNFSKIPTPEIENKILNDEIPLLPLKVPVKSQHE
ncbi:MAG: type IV secretory system conjugative DNA transfer family protein [Lentimicrobiaceae bacterium]|nr:type IV secretory system conjugative DNA transfer family protein [Lentimicrobiaceae bacterium]